MAWHGTISKHRILIHDLVYIHDFKFSSDIASPEQHGCI